MSKTANLKSLQKKLNYHFSDTVLLEQALTHRSASNNHNERLEYLGDAVLGMIIADKLFQKFPQANEGELSRLRAFLVKEKALFEVAQDFKLGDYLNLGSGELKSGGFRRASILSDALEAIIGAVYLDSQFEKTREFVLSIYGERLDQLSLEMAQKDPKTRLQEWLQARNCETPEYRVISESGKDHAKTYQVECKVAYQSLESRGSGSSRRKAEQDAAAKILESIQNV